MKTELTIKRAENGNNSKSKLCQVAVMVRYYRLFLVFREKFQKENEEFIPITKIQDVKGHQFSRIEYTIDWHDMNDFAEVEKAVLLRVR